MPKLLFNGSPGEVYTNTGDRILYQFHCQFGHSCGICISYHMSIGTSFPIPIHRGCNCTQTPIFPGGSAEPFVDFREMIRELGPSEQAAVMGKSNLRLVESGVVKYEDVVTKTRIRDLKEVVSRGKLSVGDMTGAGVDRRLADKAYESVHTPAHELANAKRAELVAKLQGKGIADDAIRRAVAERIALRVGIAEGPSGPGGISIEPFTPPVPKPPPKPRVVKPKPPPPGPKPEPPKTVAPPASRVPDHAALLDAARAEQRARNLKSAIPGLGYEKLLKDHPDLIAPGKIEDRLKAYTLGDAKVRAVIEVGSKYEGLANSLDVEYTKLGRELAASMKEREGLARQKITPKVKARIEAIEASGDAAKARRQEIADQKKTIVADRKAEVTTILKARNGIGFRVEDPDVWMQEGASGTVPIRSGTKSSIAQAHEFLSAIVEGGDIGTIEAKVGETAGKRAFYNSVYKLIQLSTDEKADVVVHEYGHAIERQMKTGGVTVGERSMEFLNYRVGDEKAVDMHAKFGKGDPGEMGRKDKFDSVFNEYEAHYIGFDYGRGDTEILSMGVQKLYNDPVTLARKDPEYFKFVVGLLDGSLR